ncbi:type III glutamate--ammonia ligase [Brevibacterium litoralis]|uniref:type III glutamate--ammonia ligase n=1 Tax=Brevibacterium litoralis TaxID=3138935 RepID=UPI0032F00821
MTATVPALATTSTETSSGPALAPNDARACHSALSDLVAAHDITYLLATFVDLNGKPCAKLVPTAALEELADGAMGFAGFAAGLIGQKPQDGELSAVPDVSSFTPMPFIREGLAMIHCDPYVGGEPWPYAPRVALKKVIADLKARGMSAKAGAEVEFFLLCRDAEGKLTTADAKDDHPRPCYDARGVTRMYDHLTEVADAMNSLGWGNYANDHEDGAGQFEQNFDYDDILVTADRVVTLRYIHAMIADKRDMIATFMGKPFSDRTGTGLHFHISLWDEAGERSLMAGPDPHGLGLSETAYQFIGGMLDHAPALQTYLAPTVNAYKRTGAANTESGATWSTNHASFGGNDRTHMIRVPDDKRVELRTADGAANPYVALTAALAAGLHGIDTNNHPGAPCGPGEKKPDAKKMPATLLHAVEALRDDPVMLAALSGDTAVGTYFADAKEKEFFDWHSRVSDWEIEHYLTAI